MQKTVYYIKRVKQTGLLCYVFLIFFSKYKTEFLSIANFFLKMNTLWINTWNIVLKSEMVHDDRMKDMSKRFYFNETLYCEKLEVLICLY